MVCLLQLSYEVELITELLDGLISKGVLSLPSVVESPGFDVKAAVSVSSREGCSSLPVRKKTLQPPINVTPAIKSDGVEEKLLTLPQFDPFSVESLRGSQLGARLARLWLEKEEREREREDEFQFWRELEFRMLEADTTIRIN